METLQAAVTLCGEQIKLRKVYAPIAGRVFMHEVTPGQVVDANEVIGEIFDESSFVIRAPLPERDYWFLRPGQSVQVEAAAYPESRFGYLTGEVAWLSNIVNPNQSGDGSVLLCAYLKAPEGDEVVLKPGMAATIHVRAGRTRLLWRVLPFRVFELIED